MKKVLALCMMFVLVVALPLFVFADTHLTIPVTSDDFFVYSHWYRDSNGQWLYNVGSVSFVDNVITFSSDVSSYYGCGVAITFNNGSLLHIDQYQSFSVSIDIQNYDPVQRPFLTGSFYLYLIGGGYLTIPCSSYDYDGASATLTVTYSAAFDLSRDVDVFRIGVSDSFSAPCVGNMKFVFGDLEVVTSVTDPDAYYTKQVINQIQTSTDEITGSIDDSTGQIVGELDEIQSEIRGDDWTSPAPGKDDDLNGAMSGYDDAYNAAVGGKSDQEIVDEVSGQVDYDYGAFDQQSVSGVTGFLTDLLDSFGDDYKSLLMLSLTIGLAVYVIGRRVSSV